MFTTPSSLRWSIDVYRVTDHEHQQRVLATLRAARRPTVTALGTHDESAWFVVIESRAALDRRWTRRAVIDLDARATRSYASKRPPSSDPVLA